MGRGQFFFENSWQGSYTNRFGSYSFNFYLLNASLLAHAPSPDPFPEDFTSQTQIQDAVKTPVLADGVVSAVAPIEMDLPPTNLMTGQWVWEDSNNTWEFGMAAVAVPRHGNRPSPVPVSWSRNQPLPGAVNVAFFDGHGDTLKLDKLWQLYWHVGYQPPAKRPGL